MEIDDIVESFRDMEHMVELDYDQLPDLPDGEPWSEGWVRFHDVVTGTMVCVNESDLEDEAEPGSLIIVSNRDITIPVDKVEKYIAVEKQVSQKLKDLQINTNQVVNSEVVNFVTNLNQMLPIQFDEAPKGWSSFFDLTTKKVVCVNRNNNEYPEEPVGTVIIVSDVNITVPEEGKKKYFSAQNAKSSMFVGPEPVAKSEVHYKF